MFIINLVSVDTAYYNRGLSTECLNLAVKLAQSRGVQKMKIDAVNEYKAAVKAGFELISETRVVKLTTLNKNSMEKSLLPLIRVVASYTHLAVVRIKAKFKSISIVRNFLYSFFML